MTWATFFVFEHTFDQKISPFSPPLFQSDAAAQVTSSNTVFKRYEPSLGAASIDTIIQNILLTSNREEYFEVLNGLILHMEQNEDAIRAVHNWPRVNHPSQ